MFLPVIVNQDVVLDSWSAVLEDGAGYGGEIFRLVEEFLAEHDVPAVRIKHQQLAPSFLGALLGNRRDCLTVVNTLDAALRTFAVHVVASDFGTALVVNWWLCARLGFFRALIEKAGYWLESKKPPVPLVVELDVFQKDLLLRGFSVVVYSALQHAIEQVRQGKKMKGGNSTSGFEIGW